MPGIARKKSKEIRSGFFRFMFSSYWQFILLFIGARQVWSPCGHGCRHNLKKGDSIMKKKWIAVVGSGVLVAGLVVTGSSFAQSDDGEVCNGTIPVVHQAEADFPAMARITLDQAVQKALATAQGRVLKTEIEDENGYLVYGIEVVGADKSIVDVKVDAGSGKVLAVEQDPVDKPEHDSRRDHKEDRHEYGHDQDREE
jgi:uncharacterized membrane protein YkoI